jgi:NAD-dependent DNA ligase
MDRFKTLKIKPIKKRLSKTMKNKIDLKFFKEEINMVQEERLKERGNIYLSLLQDFKKNGINVLQGLNENQLSNLLIEANKAYYNDSPLMTDNEYDIIKEFINKKNPKNNILLEVGAPVERNKVDLPYYMGSMDKIKPNTNAMDQWKKGFKGSYVLSCKLDGVSGLFENKDGIKRLFTRGDGVKGQDISYLIPHLKLPTIKDVAIRGEFIIPKEVFENKYKDEFANPRNMVAGILNQKKIDPKMKDIHFVAYELIEPVKKPLEQMKFLKDLDIDYVLYKEEKNISNELLSELLVKWRKEYFFEIDGIIVTNNEVYKRLVNKNPEHSFAFKMILSDQIAEAKVVDVLWAASKDGYLKPRVRIEPVYLGGVKIEYATGFNGAFIQENKIGVGAVVEIIRSGDVIPHIKSVTSPAEIVKMPDIPYKWNSTNVDILLENIDLNENVREKVITGFFKGIGVDGLGEGNIIRLINAGFDSIPKILKMKLEDFLNVEGFKGKLSSKIYEGIQIKMEEASLITLMSSSNIFGRGFSEKKIELIINDLPTILTSKESNEEKIKMVSLVKGLAKKSAEAFVEKIGDFVLFLEECGLQKKLFSEKEKDKEKEDIDIYNALFHKNIVMTGFRDKNLVDELKKVGAKNASSVSKNTFVLIVKDKEDKSGKILDAEELKIPIMTVEEFRHHYLSN